MIDNNFKFIDIISYRDLIKISLILCPYKYFGGALNEKI